MAVMTATLALALVLRVFDTGYDEYRTWDEYWAKYSCSVRVAPVGNEYCKVMTYCARMA